MVRLSKQTFCMRWILEMTSSERQANASCENFTIGPSWAGKVGYDSFVISLQKERTSAKTEEGENLVLQFDVCTCYDPTCSKWAATDQGRRSRFLLTGNQPCVQTGFLSFVWMLLGAMSDELSTTNVFGASVDLLEAHSWFSLFVQLFVHTSAEVPWTAFLSQN